MMDTTYIMSNSLCKHCYHRVSRVISIEGLEVEYYEGDEQVANSQVSEEFDSFTHEFCSKLCLELDHIVLDCTKFQLLERTN
jgi:hypothetical protein